MRGVKSTVLTGAALLSGCGDGSGGGSHPLQPPTTAIDARSQARAEAMVITAGDLPAAWTSMPSRPSSDSAVCVDGNGLTAAGKASSAEFDRTDAGYDMHVRSLALVFQSEDQAKTWFKRLGSDAVPACIEHSFTAAQSKHPTPGTEYTITGVAKLPTARAGDESSGIRLTVNVKQEGRTTPVYVDFEFIRVGDAVAALVLVSGRVPFDDAERISGSPTSADLAALIAQRMDGLRAS
jgi:hypothetical protein